MYLIDIFSTKTYKWPICRWKSAQHHQSLKVQWIRILLPMQGTGVQSLVRNDSTWHRASATITESACCNAWSSCTQTLCSAISEATTMRRPRTATKSSPYSLQQAKAQCSNEDQEPKINKYIFFKLTEISTKILLHMIGYPNVLGITNKNEEHKHKTGSDLFWLFVRCY